MPTLPYVPEAYDYGPTSRIAEMMLRAAQQQAQARYANAENLGRGIANAGQAVGDVLQQRQASQQQAAQQAELGRQDAALFALMEQNPDAGLVDYVRIAGPDRGAKVFQAQAAARKMTTVPPDQALKLLPIALDGYFAIPPGPGRARAYDNLRQVAGQSGLPVQGFPEQWDEQADQILADVQSRLRAQGEGVAQVDTIDDAGNPVTRFVPKQAGASYAKPKPEPRLDSRGFEARIADAVARGDMAAAESLRQEAGRLATVTRAPQPATAAGGASDDADVSFLMQGGTADKLPIKVRTQAVQAARASGGVDGTGFVPNNAQQQAKYSDFMDLRRKAMRMQELLGDAEVRSKLGPAMGRGVDWTKELPIIGQNTKVKEAFDLFRDLSDTELRKRSGAAISPNEYERIVGFTIDPTKQWDSNATNLTRMLELLNSDLGRIGATNLPQPITAGEWQEAGGVRFRVKRP